MKTKLLFRQVIFLIFIFSLQGFILNTGSVMLISQTTRYVATTGTNTGNDCTDSNNPCATIVHALNEASSNDIVALAAGAYTQSQSGGLLIQKSITIQGADRETTFIQAHTQPNQAGHRTITIAPLPIDVEINSLTIRNGVALGSGVPGRGGGIYYDFDVNNPGTLSIYDVKFQQNTARVGGGVFSSAGSAPVIEFVHFQANSATERGGGMYNWTDSEPEIIGVVFQSNSAGISGGGIYNTAVNLILDQSTFTGNFASFGCGAVVLQNNSMATVTTTTFINNTTSGNGGGLCMDGNSVAEFIDTNFTDNEAFGGQGGAVHIVNGSSPTFTNVGFSGNQASGNQSGDGGGAVYVSSNSVPVFVNTTFTGNTAPGSVGGGIYATDCYLSFELVSFHNNQAVSGGGIFLLEGNIGPSTLYNVTFNENTAGGHGGAFRAIDSHVLMEEVTFDSNSAGDSGGGLSLSGAQYVSNIKNGVFIGNTAGSFGGAISNAQESGAYTNVVFADNEAASGGGAVFYFNAVTPYMYNATFSGNSSSFGGALYNSSSTTHFIYNSIFWGNTATSQGNEIYNNPSSAATLHYSLVPNGTDDVVEGSSYTCNNCIEDNPLFVDAANHHFQLTENSPAINAGDPNTGTMPFPVDGNGDPIDILGNPRFFGSAIDIGAYEWNDNLSIEGIAGNPLELLVYPNPVTDVLHIESKQIIEQVSIYNLMGKLLPLTPSEGGGTNVMTVNVSGLASGVYLLKVQAEGQEGVYRIIKK